MLQFPRSVETSASWAIASVALFILGMSFGGAWIGVVALKDIAGEVNGSRSVPALASSLAWLGTGAGGIIMSRIADRIGTRWTVIFGSLMIGLGLSISTLGPPWPLWIGHGLFIGLIGIGGINAPLYIYVSRWFDRRRGSALAVVSGGTHLAADLPAGDRQFRLAADHAMVCAGGDGFCGAACGDLFSQPTGSDPSGG